MSRIDLSNLPQRFEELGIDLTEPCLLGFSGGSDSVFLAEIASRVFAPGKLYLAYVNYRDLPTAIAPEVAIVKETARRLNLPLLTLDLELDYFHVDFENEARRIRYRWFAKEAEKLGAQGVLIAHQKNDDAETYLMQKKRGGLVSYLGLKPVNDIFGVRIFRPILDLYRTDIIEYLHENDIPYFDDPTNRFTVRQRNRIRLDELTDKSRVEEVLEERDRELPILLKKIGNIENINIKGGFYKAEYQELTTSEQRRLLLRCLDALPVKLSEDRKLALVNLCYERLLGKPSQRLKLMDGLYLYPSSQRIFFGGDLPRINEREIHLHGPLHYRNEWVRIDIDDLDKIHAKSYPLTVRPLVSGDRISTDLQAENAMHFLKSSDVPMWLRDRYPGIFDAEGRLIYVPRWIRIDSEVAAPILPASLV